MNPDQEGSTYSFNDAIAAALRAERAASGATFDTIVERTGMTKSTVIRTFRGDRAATGEDIFAIAPLLGRTATEILEQAEARYAEATAKNA